MGKRGGPSVGVAEPGRSLDLECVPRARGYILRLSAEGSARSPRSERPGSNETPDEATSQDLIQQSYSIYVWLATHEAIPRELPFKTPLASVSIVNPKANDVWGHNQSVVE